MGPAGRRDRRGARAGPARLRVRAVRRGAGDRARRRDRCSPSTPGGATRACRSPGRRAGRHAGLLGDAARAAVPRRADRGDRARADVPRRLRDGDRQRLGCAPRRRHCRVPAAPSPQRRRARGAGRPGAARVALQAADLPRVRRGGARRGHGALRGHRHPAGDADGARRAGLLAARPRAARRGRVGGRRRDGARRPEPDDALHRDAPVLQPDVGLHGAALRDRAGVVRRAKTVARRAAAVRVVSRRARVRLSAGDADPAHRRDRLLGLRAPPPGALAAAPAAAAATSATCCGSCRCSGSCCCRCRASSRRCRCPPACSRPATRSSTGAAT